MTDMECAREIYNRAVIKQWGRERDIAAAVQLYCDSANLGFSGAQNNLGYCYEKGLGVQQSDVAAVHWYTKASERGEPTAYLGLATVLFKIAADNFTRIEAHKYALLAKALLVGGNQKLAENLEKDIALTLSTEALSQSYALASQWSPLAQEEYLIDDSPEFTPLPPASQN